MNKSGVALVAVVVILGVFLNVFMRVNVDNLANKINDIWTDERQITEDNYREKSRDMLEQGKHCINAIMYDEKVAIKDFKDKLFFAMDTCMKKARTTTTGDSFAVRLLDEMFVYDPSLDCLPPSDNGKKFYGRHDSEQILKMIDQGEQLEYPECYLHKVPDLCFLARSSLLSGYDSTPADGVYWQFDNAYEWLEWVVLPSEDYGFDGIPRGNERLKPNQYVLALGVQSDEIPEFVKIDNNFESMITFINSTQHIVLITSNLVIFLVLLYSALLGRKNDKIHT